MGSLEGEEIIEPAPISIWASAVRIPISDYPQTQKNPPARGAGGKRQKRPRRSAAKRWAGARLGADSADGIDRSLLFVCEGRHHVEKLVLGAASLSLFAVFFHPPLQRPLCERVAFVSAQDFP